MLKLLKQLEALRVDNQKKSVKRNDDKTLYAVGVFDGVELGLCQAIEALKKAQQDERGLEDELD